MCSCDHGDYYVKNNFQHLAVNLCCIPNVIICYCRYAADVWCNKPLATTLRLIKEHLKVDTQTLHHCTKRPPLSVNGYRKPRYLLYKLCFGVGTVWGVKTCAGSILASCHTSQTSRISGLKFEENFEVDPKFDWNKFFALLWPHIYYLLAAIAVCLLHMKYKFMVLTVLFKLVLINLFA